MKLYESEDGTELLRKAMTTESRTLLLRRSADPGALTLLDDSWTEIDIPDDLPVVGWSCCIRCHRLNAGPCISSTCSDLQVAPIWKEIFNGHD